MSFLELTGVSKRLGGERQAVDEISLSIPQHARFGIVGETGSGKSTLLKLISGHEQLDAGTVLYQGKKVKGPEDQLIAGHPEMQYLSQYFELREFITVSEYLDNIYLIAEEDAEKIYHACQIEHLLDKDTRHLSGGEKQRVALAKALTHEPEVLLLDEPFSNLDFIHKRQMKRVVEQVNEELGTTIILVSHDPRDVLSWAEQVVVLKDGKIVQVGDPEQVYRTPENEYVAGLFGRFYLLDPKEWSIPNDSSLPVMNGQVFVRPENFSISKEGGTTKSGLVKRVDYNGSFDELEIEVTGIKIHVPSEVGLCKTGDQVLVTLVPE